MYKTFHFVRNFIFVSLFHFVFLHLYSETPRQKQMLGDLDVICNFFRTQYAPAQWKRELFGWELTLSAEETAKKVLTGELFSGKEFQNALKNFFLSAKDYHVGISFYSTESAYLPFEISRAEGRFFVTHLMDSEEEPLPLQVGDEIVSFNGVPLSEIANKLQKEMVGNNHPATDEALTDLYLTMRLGASGSSVPQGEVRILGKTAKTNKEFEVFVDWEYSKEKVSDLPMPQFYTKEPFALSKKQLVKKNKVSSKKNLRSSVFKKQAVMAAYPAMSQWIKKNHYASVFGGKKNIFPRLGPVFWESSEESIFDAYIFSLPNHARVGYIRIPSYDISEEQEALDEILTLLSLFERQTDLLVIDQMYNPGGSVLYLYSLLSAFTTKPLEVPSHRMMITQEEVFEAQQDLQFLELIETLEEIISSLGEDLSGYEPSFEFLHSLKSYFTDVIAQWDSGKNMTDPLYLFGISTISPRSSIAYTKPKVVLANGMSFSGGDFFPLILQKNKEAVIIGTRTAGAGGCVTMAEFPNLSGISNIHYTSSIAQYSSNEIVENIGTAPDITLEFTAKDLQMGFPDFCAKLCKELMDLIPEKPKKRVSRIKDDRKK